jgi:hypothetical protein
MYRRTENMLDLARRGYGMKESRCRRVTGGVSRMAGRTIVNFPSGCVRSPCRCTQRCRAWLTLGKRFRFGDGFSRAGIKRVARLEDRQDVPSAGGGKQRDLPEFLFLKSYLGYVGYLAFIGFVVVRHR